MQSKENWLGKTKFIIIVIDEVSAATRCCCCRSRTRRTSVAMATTWATSEVSGRSRRTWPEAARWSFYFSFFLGNKSPINKWARPGADRRKWRPWCRLSWPASSATRTSTRRWILPIGLDFPSSKDDVPCVSSSQSSGGRLKKYISRD